MEQVLKTAVGVFIGGLAAAFVYTEIQTVRLEIAGRKALQTMQKGFADGQKLDRDMAQAAALAQAKAKAAESQRQQAIQQLAAETETLARLRRQDKEEAWRRFYEPSDSCKQNSLQDHCANAHIKAKTIFESQYTPIR